MSFDTVDFKLDAIGAWGPGAEFIVRSGHIREYAEVTGDHWSSASRGDLAGPVFPVAAQWDCMEEMSGRLVPASVAERVLHYTQDMRIHRPLRGGMRVMSRGAPVGVLRRPSGTQTVYCVKTWEQDELLVEAWLTEYYPGLWPSEECGNAGPPLEEEPGDPPERSLEIAVPADITSRYADVSFDDFPIHLDEDAARRVGLPGRIVHGLCTLAMSANALLESGLHDVDAVGRVAARFNRPLLLGAPLTVSSWTNGGDEIRFTATSGADTVLRNGILVVH